MKITNPFLELPDSKNIRELKEIERLLEFLETINLKITKK